MEYCEAQFYNEWELEWGRQFSELILQYWSHFLEDCQTPLDKNNVKAEELLNTLLELY